MSRNSGCMQYVIALVAALSVHDPLLRHKYAHEEGDGKEKDEPKSTGNVGIDAEIKKQKGMSLFFSLMMFVINGVNRERREEEEKRGCGESTQEVGTPTI